MHKFTLFLVVVFFSSCHKESPPRVVDYSYLVELTDSVVRPVDSSKIFAEDIRGPGEYLMKIHIENFRVGGDAKMVPYAKLIGDPKSPDAVFYNLGARNGSFIVLFKGGSEKLLNGYKVNKIRDRVYQFYNR